MKTKFCLTHSVIYDADCAECRYDGMHCYKCDTTDELSRKTTKLFICRTCRRIEYERSKIIKVAKKIDYRKMTDKIDPEQWKITAKETVKRISKKHA